jgi:predicted AlkP superfamily phosphohydrolase/phosphomutase
MNGQECVRDQAAKVAIIGLDGADWHLLSPWIRNGDLPTLAKLVSEGTTGKLRSTIRPESSVAWSSFSTGVNPGQHGVFGFVEQVAKGYSFKLASGSSVRVRRFWDLLGDQGLKVGILNVPFTYPPSPVNGFMVTGMLTPGTDVAFTYPKELQQRLLNRFENYLLDAGDAAEDKAALVDHVRASTHQQREAALFLLQEQPWDCFAMVFTGPDRLQHFLWADMDSEHPLHDPETAHRFGQTLLEHYQALDTAIAEILEHLPANTLVLFMSDHGFNGCARRFYVNRWLRNHGWLELRETSHWRSGLASLFLRLGAVGWLRRLKRTIFPTQWSSTDLRSAMFSRAFDWPRTRAYFGLDGGLRINLRGREPEGIVSPAEYNRLRRELCQALLAVTDPETEQPPLSNVFLREELYQGRFADRAPDLILEPRRDDPTPAYNVVLDGSLRADEATPFGSSLPYSGNHTLDGIFCAWGKDVVRGGRIQNAQIVDLAPTVLAALGVAVPDYMDGRVLSEIFLPGRAPTPGRAEGSKPAPPDELERTFSREDEMAVENRLRSLGYLD